MFGPINLNRNSILTLFFFIQTYFLDIFLSKPCYFLGNEPCKGLIYIKNKVVFISVDGNEAKE